MVSACTAKGASRGYHHSIVHLRRKQFLAPVTTDSIVEFVVDIEVLRLADVFLFVVESTRCRVGATHHHYVAIVFVIHKIPCSFIWPVDSFQSHPEVTVTATGIVAARTIRLACSCNGPIVCDIALLAVFTACTGSGATRVSQGNPPGKYQFRQKEALHPSLFR
jgi:hypothetical protein